MNKKELKDMFDEKYPNLLRLKNNLEEALRIFLDESKISYLAVSGRVKSFESFYEKIYRKNYTNPFKQTEDLIGIRVILYFHTDINDVNRLISRNFIVEEFEDKASKLLVNEFGYRSHHCIIKIHKEWCKTPNYRGLEGIKSEIQVRTILMHAWAEVEHKLQYKNTEQVPRELQRKLFLLSAKFEEADQQFEDVRDSANKYSKEIAENLRLSGKFDVNLEFNLETFKQFLSFFYPNNQSHEVMEKDMFEIIRRSGKEYSELVDIAMKFREMEKYLESRVSPLNRSVVFKYALDTIVPGVCDIDNYMESRKDLVFDLRGIYESKV